MATAPVPDYLVVAPQAYVQALEPLLRHRRAGGHIAELLVSNDIQARFASGQNPVRALAQAINQRFGKSTDQLRYLLIVGDIIRHGEPAVDRVASFYLPKLDYTTHRHRDRHLFHRSLLRVDHDHHAYPSDHPFSMPRADGSATIAVGRVPARSAAEVRAFVSKLIRYETSPLKGEWPRRVLLRAGPANFGRAIDALLESVAMLTLDEQVPYEYDLAVTFAKPGSRYADRFDRLGQTLTTEANQGAFLMAYVGHSSPAYFGTVTFRDSSYSVGSRRDFERMRISKGAPIFVSLSCDVGAFDMSKGRRSIAEEAVLNPAGAIAAFAASRVSHPYPNLLYGEALVEALLKGRPRTLGEGILAVKRAMIEGSNFAGELLLDIDTDLLKREHESLYNLFGDPATRLRYPKALSIALAGKAKAGQPLTIQVRSADISSGKLTITLETRRKVISKPLVGQEAIEEMPTEEALAAIAENHARASDKVLVRQQTPLRKGAADVALPAPAKPGNYVIKTYLQATGDAAWGHIRISVE